MMREFTPKRDDKRLDAEERPCSAVGSWCALSGMGEGHLTVPRDADGAQDQGVDRPVMQALGAGM